VNGGGQGRYGRAQNSLAKKKDSHGPHAPSPSASSVGLGEAVCKLAALCEYPGKRARFHACYYDLREDVDYNYLSVPS